MINNEYIPFYAQIKEVIKHTNIEYTFRLAFEGEVRPGQFFEVSIPKYGEAPISVSGMGEGYVDLTIRKVGKVTNEIFEQYQGKHLFLRGPYGNGFMLDDYRNKELLIVAGGTGVSPVRAVIDYFACHPKEVKNLTVIAGFKSPHDILFREDFKRWEKSCNLILTVDAAEENSGYRVGLVTKYLDDLKFEDISKAAAVVAGPPSMMRFTTMGLERNGFTEENIWISHERKMCCGIGKCGHCKIDDVYVCLNGPVFPYSKGRKLLD